MHYTGEDFKGLLKHPSFKWEIEHYKFGYSQEFMTYLLQEILPQCQPHQDLPAEVVQKHEDKYQNNRIQNPELSKYHDNMADFYDSMFGEGRYASKYGPLPQNDSNAAVWNWSLFSQEVF